MTTRTATNDKHDRQKAINELRDLIGDIHVAMLTTVTEEGTLQSRPMITARHEFDGTLWFFSLDNDPKVKQIGDHSTVNLAYSDPSAGRFVSISGNADLVRDAKRAEVLWTEELADWFPDGPTDPSLALIRVDVEEAEYWDSKHNRLASLARALFFGGGKKRKHDKIDWSHSAG